MRWLWIAAKSVLKITKAQIGAFGEVPADGVPLVLNTLLDSKPMKMDLRDTIAVELIKTLWNIPVIEFKEEATNAYEMADAMIAARGASVGLVGNRALVVGLVGSRALVVGDNSGHGFSLGEEVKLIYQTEDSYVATNGDAQWHLGREDFKVIT